MTVTITCTYDAADKVRNALDDLIGTGIPREEIYVEEEFNRIKVFVPKVARPEIEEILGRHGPSRIE